jgi:hypothetical protein
MVPAAKKIGVGIQHNRLIGSIFSCFEEFDNVSLGMMIGFGAMATTVPRALVVGLWTLLRQLVMLQTRRHAGRLKIPEDQAVMLVLKISLTSSCGRLDLYRYGYCPHAIQGGHFVQ